MSEVITFVGGDSPTSKLGYEEIFKATPCFLTVQDHNYRIISANDLHRKVFGEGIGKYCYEVYKKRTERCRDCPVNETFEDGLIHRSEQDVVLPDGRKMPILAYTAPITDSDGTVTHAVKVSADITPVKLLEEKLRESRERFRLLFEEVPCYISVQDRDLKIVQANSAFKRDFGDYIGAAYCYEVYKRRGEPCIRCPVAKSFSDGRSHQSEEVVIARDGQPISTLVITAPILDTNGKVIQVMEVSTNITDVRKLQDQLSQLGLLVGSISHGIKGLLTGLDGGMYLMNTGFENNRPDRIEKGWKMIRRNVEQVRSIVLDLLYIAKEREPEWHEVDILELLKDVSRMFAKKAADMGIKLRVELAPDIGTAQADQKSLKASLVNILENSIDACRVDTKDVSHSISLVGNGSTDEVTIVVEDNGIGMDQETKSLIFSLFFSSKGMEGTGLGLFIANKVVEKHGGTISVESEPGNGTRFTIKLPRQRRE
ncbi:MAG: PAS domain-containing protein [Deltaproteobacteria bacterium]|nr:PAS domain-containing protein [Deltaproteobacteria bacterium]